MRYVVILSTDTHDEVVGKYWLLSAARANAMADARAVAEDDNYNVIIRHHMGEEYYVGEIGKRNNATDKMIDDVIDALKMNGGVSNGYGYITMNGITIRVKDHTHNPARGKCDVSVVIANKDATANKYVEAREDLRYNEDDDIHEIVSDILARVSEKVD